MEDALVSVVIPTLNAEEELAGLLDRLGTQTVAPAEIIIIDSSSDDRTVEIAESYPLVRLIEINRADFDHGGTRAMGFREAGGEYVLYLTQDAVPADNHMIENLLRPFDDADVAIVSGRQLPKEDARPFERLVREFNYSPESNKRTKRDIQRLGIKAFFSSDVCCMYRRASIEAIGGIPAPCSTNEDMLAAARCLRADMSVCYAADACVYHSHNLTFAQQYARNKEIGIFLATHKNELRTPSELGEGRRLVRYVLSGLWKEREMRQIASFCGDCIARIAGNYIGKRIVK